MAISEKTPIGEATPQVIVLQAAPPARGWFEPVLNIAGWLGGGLGAAYMMLKSMAGANIDITAMTAAEKQAEVEANTLSEKVKLSKQEIAAADAAFNQAAARGELVGVLQKPATQEFSIRAQSAKNPTSFNVNAAISEIGNRTPSSATHTPSVTPSLKVSAKSVDRSSGVVSAAMAKRLFELKPMEDVDAVAYLFHKNGTCDARIMLADQTITLRDVPRPQNLHACYAKPGVWTSEITDPVDLFTLKQPGGIIHHALSKRADWMTETDPTFAAQAKKGPVWGKFNQLDFNGKFNVVSVALMGVFVGGMVADLINMGARAMGFTGREAARPPTNPEATR